MDGKPDSRFFTLMHPSDLDARFFGPVATKMRANLEMLIGRAIAFVPGTGRRMEGEALRAALATSTVGFRALVSGESRGQAMILTEPAGATALATLVQMVPDSTIVARLADPATCVPNAAETETLGEVGNFLVAAVSDVARDLCGGKLKFAPEAPVVTGASDFLADDDYVAGFGRFIVEGVVEASCVVVVPVSALAILLPGSIETSTSDPTAMDAPLHEAPSAAPSVGPAPRAVPVNDIEVRTAALVVVGSEAAAVLVGGALAPTHAAAPVGGMGDLVKLLDAGVTPAVVVIEIPEGREWAIETFGTLKRHPSLAKSRLIALLAAPTRAFVVRCAMAGFSSAMPPSAGQEALRARLLPLLPSVGASTGSR